MMKELILFIMGLVGFSSGWAQKAKQSKATTPKSEVKFLDDQNVDFYASVTVEKTVFIEPELQFTGKNDTKTFSHSVIENHTVIENVDGVQLKYALLLNTEVEQVRNARLFSVIDEWYGTPYQFGGSSKRGVDCSGFVKTLFSTFYGLTIPRTAQEQYELSQPVALSELKEGDLVFFNTQGGVSHVGIYLLNNRFVHSATSEGVTISDLRENYWERRFIGAGRVPVPATTDTLAVK